MSSTPASRTWIDCRAGIPDELRGFRRRVGDVHRRGERDGVPVHRRHFLDLGERPAGATVPRQPAGQRQVALAGSDSGSARRCDRWRGLAVDSSGDPGRQGHPRGGGVVVFIELHELPRCKPGAILHRDRPRALHGVSGEIHRRSSRRCGANATARRGGSAPARRAGSSSAGSSSALPRSTQRDALPDPDMVVDRERARGELDDLALGAGVDRGLDARRRFIPTVAVGGRIDGRAHPRARGNAAHARCPCREGGATGWGRRQPGHLQPSPSTRSPASRRSEPIRDLSSTNSWPESQAMIGPLPECAVNPRTAHGFELLRPTVGPGG